MMEHKLKCLDGHQEPYRAILTRLRERGCVADSTLAGREVTIRWCEGGFEQALAGMKRSEEPFGLKERERTLFVALMWQADGMRVMKDFIVPRVNAREGRGEG